MEIDLLKSILFNTVVLSFIYILASLGFAFIFNMMGTINFAHGAIYMTSAFVCYYTSRWLGVSNWWALFITIIVIGLFGILLERTVFRVFMNNMNRTIMISVALISIMQTTITITAGTKEQIIESFIKGTTMVFGLSVSKERLLILCIGAACLIAVLIIVNKTTLGQQMEAIAQDRIGAALQGININLVSAIVCAIGFILAAIAGCMMGSLQRIGPSMGDVILVRILMIVMLAGVGSKSMNGLIVTGFIIGLVDSTLPIYIPGSAASAVTAVVVLLLMLIRPTGFFGHEM